VYVSVWVGFSMWGTLRFFFSCVFSINDILVIDGLQVDVYVCVSFCVFLCLFRCFFFFVVSLCLAQTRARLHSTCPLNITSLSLIRPSATAHKGSPTRFSSVSSRAASGFISCDCFAAMKARTACCSPSDQITRITRVCVCVCVCVCCRCRCCRY
jgi:hypothetical protein